MEDSTIVACPSCGKKYKIGADKVGRTFKCVACQTQFQAGVEAVPAELTEVGVVEPPTSPQPPAFDPSMQAAPVMNYNAGGMADGMQPKTSGMAIASLVCGILFCVPFSGLLAIIFGIIGITQTKPGMQKGRGMAIAGTVLGSLGMVIGGFAMLASILLPSLNKARETANRAKCASNMHQIGLAILLYQNENQQEYPPDLTTLMQNEQLSASVFICPSSNDTPAASPSQLETGGHLSYKYIYPGPRASHPQPAADEAVLYEQSTDHTHDGMNILFGDGHAEWFKTAAAQKYINKP